MRVILFATVFVCGVTACKFGSTDTSSVVKSEDGTVAPIEAPAPVSAPAPGVVPNSTENCDTLCNGVDRDFLGLPTDAAASTWAACFSCRCKTALGRLPPPEELRCSSAPGPLARYKARVESGRVNGVEVINPAGTNPEEPGCLNGGIAAAKCDLQSRFKRILYDEGDLEFQLLCRKPLATSTGYYEYLIIGHNQKNGATCFWQSRGTTFNGEDTVQMDLTGAKDSPENRLAYARTFETRTAGPSHCTACHSNDAFIWSPYFDSYHNGGAAPEPYWNMNRARNDPKVESRIATDRKYFQVVANSPALKEVNEGQDLTATGQPLEEACGECHRVAQSDYCSMARLALGANDFGLDEASAFEQVKRFTHWMPPKNRTLAQFRAMRTQVQNACR